jgi:hypothetical protein
MTASVTAPSRKVQIALVRAVNLDPVATAKVSRLSGDEHVLADVNELVDLGPPGLPLLIEHLPQTLHLFAALVDATPRAQVA